MKINSNITAYVTNNSYRQNEIGLANATAKLSSGYKLNTSGDDPANFAIAAKLRSMIKGLDKVKTNTTTGLSVMETAEAAITETQSMIQRMNELSIKASNGTLSTSDRNSIQAEVDELIKEIDRIADTTEFNGQKLLNGTFQDKGYTNNTNVTIMDYREETPAGKYQINLTRDSGGNYKVEDVSGLPAGTKTAKELFGTTDPAKLRVESRPVPQGDGSTVDYVTVRGYGGSEIRFKVAGEDITNPLELDLSGRGSMRLQVGTEEGEVISASLPLMTTEAMGLAGLDMSTKEGARDAIDKIETALDYANGAKSRIGAYVNRIENTSDFLDAYDENIDTSLSRIQDTDMSQSMVEYANKQILSQAGISMLSQANEAPQQALQLLQ